jgi:hypothetical protein
MFRDGLLIEWLGCGLTLLVWNLFNFDIDYPACSAQGRLAA